MKEHSDELGASACHWFEVMRKCGSDVRELLHDGHPTACVKDAAFAYVNAFKAHVNVGFFRGAEIADPEGLLQGTGFETSCVPFSFLFPGDSARWRLSSINEPGFLVSPFSHGTFPQELVRLLINRHQVAPDGATVALLAAALLDRLVVERRGVDQALR